jgi:predicted transcriptional regulator
MYAYKGVSREEWLFRGLAIATILALVGMAVLPAVHTGNYLAYLAAKNHDSDYAAGAGAAALAAAGYIHIAPEILHFLLEAGVIASVGGPVGLVALGIGIGLIALSA